MESAVLKNKKVLIVDDYQINTELLSILVEEAGASALTASNGKQCIEIVKREHVDMVLMDKNMPVMDGLDASRAVRSLQQGKNVVIVGITGGDESMESDACMQAGMDMVCEKTALNGQKLDEIGERFFGNRVNGFHPDTPELVRDTGTVEHVRDNHSVMDLNKAIGEFENDRDLVYSLMKDFNTLCISKIVLMRKALEIPDYNYIRNESHGIKGGAANLCAIPLSNAASALESACRQCADSGTIGTLLDNLAICLDSFTAFVKNTCPE